MSTRIDPIADLTYRNYNGPLEEPRRRWWVIARTTIRLSLSKRIFWVATFLASWYYLVMLAVIFFAQLAAQSAMEQAGGALPPQAAERMEFLSRIIWKEQLVHGFSFGSLIFMLITLLVGAGAVANDNRANALLVYLSKPCTKADYVFGKFVGVWIPLFIAMGLPTAVFWLYGATSYRNYGFMSDPLLGLKALGAIAIGAAVHASLVLGVSSLFKQARLAGGLYCGIYMITNLFTVLIGTALAVSEDAPAPGLVNAFYASIDGVIIGLMKATLGTDGRNMFGTPGAGTPVDAPPFFPILGICLGLIAIGLGLFASRVRAVEVVG